MKITSVSIVRHPRVEVWEAIRDRLPEMVPYLDEIESITIQKRDERADGTVRLVNLWKAKPKLPSIVAGHIRPEMFAWTDHAEYRAKTFECCWRLEPHFMPERIRCAGVTRYEPALGGRGTRINFSGDLELAAKNLPGVPAILEGAIISAMEAFLKTLIPKNFRKLTDAVGQFLDAR